MSGKPLDDALCSLSPARPPEGAKERSWARLAAAPPAPRRSWGRVALVAAVLLVVVAVAGAWAAQRGAMGPAPARVRIAWDDAKRDAPLTLGESVETGGREALVGDGATFLAWLSAGARARVERHGDGLLIRLGRGEVRVWSAHRRPDAALEIVTARHRVRVVGTLFTVRTGPRGDAVWVAKGSVEVQGGGAFARLVPGARWSSGEETPSALPAEGIEWLRARVTAGDAGLRGGWSEVRRSEVRLRGATTRTTVSTPPALAALRPAAPAAGAPNTRTRRPSEAEPESEPESESEPEAESESEPEPEPESESEPEPESEPESDGQARVAGHSDEARQAMELERQGRLPEALVRYREIARGTGAAAEFALYRAGRLQMRRQRDLAGALATFREARRRFPGGGLRQEMDLSILDALVRAGRRAEAATEAAAFLRRWPSSERRAEVEAIRDRLAGELEVDR